MKHIQSLRNRIYAQISRLNEKIKVIKLKEIMNQKDRERKILIDEFLLNGKLKDNP